MPANLWVSVVMQGRNHNVIEPSESFFDVAATPTAITISSVIAPILTGTSIFSAPATSRTAVACHVLDKDVRHAVALPNAAKAERSAAAGRQIRALGGAHLY